MNLLPFIEKVCQERLNINHIIVTQNNEEVGSFHFQKTSRRDNIHSATKSILSLAIGMAIDENILSLNDKPIEVLRNRLPRDYGKIWEDVTLYNLLTMSSGHTEKLLNGYSMTPGVVNRDDLSNTDWVNYIFSNLPQKKPGSLFVYNNACPYLAGEMLVAKCHENIIDYLRPRLFEPLRINNPQWLTDPQGHSCGAGGIFLSCEELSRIGNLCLGMGSWNGKQLVSKEYIDSATKKQIESKNDFAVKVDVVQAGDKDFSSGYGLLFWKASREKAYYMYGWASQLCIIIPSLNAVISITSYDFQTQKILDYVFDYIVPELKA